MTRSTGDSGLMMAGSLPAPFTASRIAARSATPGTPVKSCMSTRAGRYDLARSRRPLPVANGAHVIGGDRRAVLASGADSQAGPSWKWACATVPDPGRFSRRQQVIRVCAPAGFQRPARFQAVLGPLTHFSCSYSGPAHRDTSASAHTVGRSDVHVARLMPRPHRRAATARRRLSLIGKFCAPVWANSTREQGRTRFCSTVSAHQGAESVGLFRPAPAPGPGPGHDERAHFRNASNSSPRGSVLRRCRRGRYGYSPDDAPPR